jgi:hypothetical protein
MTLTGHSQFLPTGCGTPTFGPRTTATVGSIMKLIHDHEEMVFPSHTQRRKELSKGYTCQGHMEILRTTILVLRNLRGLFSSPLRLKRLFSSRRALFQPPVSQGGPNLVFSSPNTGSSSGISCLHKANLSSVSKIHSRQHLIPSVRPSGPTL